MGREETANDQLKTHLRGPGHVLRSRLPELVYQEIWAYLMVHYAISVLVTRAAEAADLDPDRICSPGSCASSAVPPPGRRTFPPEHWDELPLSWPRSPQRSTPPGGTGPARARSDEPTTTTTASRNPTNAPAPATTPRPPSRSTLATPCEQHDQFRLRGIGSGSVGCEARGKAQGSLSRPEVTGEGKAGRVNNSELLLMPRQAYFPGRMASPGRIGTGR